MKFLTKEIYNKTAVSLFLGLAISANANAADPTSKLSAEKQAELNKLIAEAVKEAGIELEDEELTIVIVKKPGATKEDKSESEVSAQVIGDIAEEGSKGIPNEVERTTGNSQVTELSEVEPIVSQEVKDTIVEAAPTNKENTKQLLPTTEEDTTHEQLSKDQNAEISGDKQEVSTISQDQETAFPFLAPEEPAQSIAPIDEPKTLAVDAKDEYKAKPKHETASQVDKNTIKTEQITDSPEPSAISDTELANESIPAKASKVIEDTAVLQQRELEKQQQSTGQAYSDELHPSDVVPQESNEYFGDYISPNRQVDSYYSSDILEAIAKANSSVDQDIEIPENQIVSAKLPALESNEMSDLVVVGALDSTAAGGVSTTTLKTVVVVPDTDIFDDIEKDVDEESEELKDALNQDDLNKRVKEALEQLSAAQNRGNSSGNTNIGAMNATGVNVTATLSSRATNNSLTNIRQTNLNNTNFR